VNWNITAVLNTSGSVVERYVYEPYGQVTYLTATWGSQSSSTVAWVYQRQGQRLDVSVGTYDSRARVYDPTLGRWFSPDPLGLRPDTNSYRFVQNGPTNATDPSGLQDVKKRDVKKHLVDSFYPNYKTPTKEGTYTREQFEELISKPERFSLKGQKTVNAIRLDIGCIGFIHMCMISDKYYRGLTPDQLRSRMRTLPPQRFQGIQGPWLKLEDAINLRGVKKLPTKYQYIVFAFIGDWKTVKVGDEWKPKKPEPDSNGKVPIDSIVFLDRKGGIAQWDYALYQPSTKLWVGVNHAAKVGNNFKDDQKFYVKKQLNGFTDPNGKEHTATIYFAYIREV
jgi:RHS repeat-associated protein